MSSTLEHVQVGQEQPSEIAARRPGLLAVLAEAVRAARAVSSADASTRVTIAARFADRVS